MYFSLLLKIHKKLIFWNFTVQPVLNENINLPQVSKARLLAGEDKIILKNKIDRCGKYAINEGRV